MSEAALALVSQPKRQKCRTCSRWERDLVDGCCEGCQRELIECKTCNRLNPDDEAVCQFCGATMPVLDEDLQGGFWRKVDESRELDRDGV